MKNMRTNALAAGTALALSLCFAPSAEAGRIHGRKTNQQDRIAQGVASGQLNPRETARLETREAHLNREVARMRADNDGALTARQHARVERQQDRLSRNIYQQKHDGQSQ
jgi:hypothetical protein